MKEGSDPSALQTEQPLITEVPGIVTAGEGTADDAAPEPSVDKVDDTPIIDSVPGVVSSRAPEKDSETSTIPFKSGTTVGGYTNIRSHQPGTVYQTGMPIRLDADINPQDGDPVIPKLT